MKTGKYIPLGYHNDVKVGYGTVDQKKLKTIYIKLNSWLEPENNDTDYNRIVLRSQKKIKNRIYDLGSDFFKKESIVDFDVRTKGLKSGKKSFLNLEITLFTEKQFDIRSEEMKTMMENLCQNILEIDLDNEKLFNFHKNKK